MTDDDATELAAARQLIREHFAMMLSAGKDPLCGVMWGPNVERFDHLLHALAVSSDVAVANLPWTIAERVEADNACRLAAVFDGPPFLPESQCRADLPIRATSPISPESA